MKNKTAKTGFDRYFADRMKDREFAAVYAEARAGIDSVDAFVRSLDEVRSKAGVSKALLAKRTGTQPAAMRRLLTMDAPNPTLATVMSIVRSLGYSLALVPAQGRAKRGRTRKTARPSLLRYDAPWDSVSVRNQGISPRRSRLRTVRS